MFQIFKRKTELEKLEINYRKLISEAYQLSTINRQQSDLKTAEAEEVLKAIEKIKAR